MLLHLPPLQENGHVCPPANTRTNTGAPLCVGHMAGAAVAVTDGRVCRNSKPFVTSCRCWTERSPVIHKSGLQVQAMDDFFAAGAPTGGDDTAAAAGDSTTAWVDELEVSAGCSWALCLLLLAVFARSPVRGHMLGHLASFSCSDTSHARISYSCVRPCRDASTHTAASSARRVVM
jgi:hypothetical protein